MTEQEDWFNDLDLSYLQMDSSAAESREKIVAELTAELKQMVLEERFRQSLSRLVRMAT